MKIKKLRHRSPSLAIVLALLQIAIGGSFSLIFTFGYLFSFIPFFNAGTRPALFGLALFLALLIWGIWNCTISYRFYKLSKILLGKTKGAAITLDQLAQDMKMPADKVLEEIHATMAHKFWSGYGLTETTLVLVDSANNSGTILASPEKEFAEAPRRSQGNIVLFALVWLLFLIFPGFANGYYFIVAGALSVIVFLLGNHMFPQTTAILQKDPEEIVEEPFVPEPAKTGSEESDSLIDEGLRHLADLIALDKSIEDPKVDKPVRELTDITRQIFDFVKKEPAKTRQLRQFIKYYLPTTIKLLKNYEELNRQPVKGENIKESINKIEGIMENILTTFRRQLDDLYRDSNMDISAEISVMENMMDGKDGIVEL